MNWQLSGLSFFTLYYSIYVLLWFWIIVIVIASKQDYIMILRLLLIKHFFDNRGTQKIIEIVSE